MSTIIELPIKPNIFFRSLQSGTSEKKKNRKDETKAVDCVNNLLETHMADFIWGRSKMRRRFTNLTKSTLIFVP